jgi:ESS family glutamate:Na+ symporter
MNRDVSRYLAPDFLSLTIGIVVYFVGVLTTQRVKFLRNLSIPEPVSAGFIAVAVVSLITYLRRGRARVYIRSGYSRKTDAASHLTREPLFRAH